MVKYSKQVSLGYDINGKRIRKRVYADTKQELIRREKEMIRNSDRELQSNITFGTYAQQWAETYKSNKSEATQELYKYTLRKLEPLFYKQIKDITRMDVQRLVNSFSDRPTSAQMVAMTAQQILESAAADNLIQPKYLKIDLPKRPKREKRPLTPSEKTAVKAAKLGPMERLFIDIEFYLGLRPEETRALQPRDFDLVARTVTINKAVAVHKEAILKETKTGRTRTIPVPDVLCAEIRAYNAHFSGFYYFTDDQGRLMNKGKYSRFCRDIFAKINEALGGNEKMNLLNGMTMYTFRHNRATELYYLAGVSTKKKAEYMGHSEIMFLRTYSHLDESRENDDLLRRVL